MTIESSPQGFQEKIDEVHENITAHLGKIDKQRKDSRKFRKMLLLLNAFSLGVFLADPNAISAILPIVIAAYNVHASLWEKKTYERMEKETRDLRRKLIREELRLPGGYLVPMKGRAPQELRDKVLVREMIVRNSVRTPNPRNN